MGRAGTLLNGFIGTVGPLVGLNRKGRHVIKTRPAWKKNRKFSPAQLAQQARFRLVNTYLNDMSDVFRLAFRDLPGNLTTINAAVQYALKNAVTGTYPDYSLDWSKVKISSGKLYVPESAMARANGTNIQFTWSTEIPPDTSRRGKAIIVAYCPEQFLCYYDTSFSRSSGVAEVNIDSFAGQTVHTYIGFISEDGRQASASFYTGQFTL